MNERTSITEIPCITYLKRNLGTVEIEEPTRIFDRETIQNLHASGSGFLNGHVLQVDAVTRNEVN